MMQSADWHGHYSRAGLLLNWFYTFVLTDEWMHLEFLNQYIDISMVTLRAPTMEDLLWVSGTMYEAKQTICQTIEQRESEQMEALGAHFFDRGQQYKFGKALIPLDLAAWQHHMETDSHNSIL